MQVLGKTALQVASEMPLPGYAHDALRYDRHPQQRTVAFHRFYGQPIHGSAPTRTFEHMSDERVAFRVAFILSEVGELLRKGLGVSLNVTLSGKDKEGNWFSSDEMFSEEDDVCKYLAQMLEFAGNRNLIETVDALGDLNVVVNGFAIELGVDMKLVDQEVCASNFTKAGKDGKPIIGDGTTGPVGKVMKGPNYVEPQLALTLGLGEK